MNASYHLVQPLLHKTVKDSLAWHGLLPSAFEATPYCLSFLNAHAVNMAVKDDAFAQLLLNSDALLRDGVGVEIALKLFKQPATPNLNGTDLIPEILRAYQEKKLTIAIYGTRDEVLEVCANNIETEGMGKVVSRLHGFHPHEVYLQDYQQHKPQLTLLCMGMPRQEKLAMALRELHQPGVIVCAGGWADFHSGIKPRAPLWVRKLKAEWLHRLAHEPMRLGRRYTIELLGFFWVLWKGRKTAN